MELHTTVGSHAHFVDDRGLEVHVDRARHVLAAGGLGEESVERITFAADRLVRGHLAIRLDAVLEAVKLPAGITNLDTSLTNVN